MNAEELSLIQRARTESQAFATLFNQYLPLVLKTVKAYYIRDFAYDDWLQEARIAMLNAVRRYDGSSGSRFGSFYRMVLVSHINSLLRNRLAQKRMADATAIIIPDPIPTTFGEGTVSYRIEENLFIRAELAHFIASLSDLERAGLIAQFDQATRKPDRRAVERSRAKFGSYLKEQLY